MWLIEVMFAIGILAGTMYSVSIKDYSKLDYRFLGIPLLFAISISGALQQHFETGKSFFGISEGFANSLFLLSVFIALFLSILLNINRLRFPIDELLYTTQLSIIAFLVMFLSRSEYGFSLFLSLLPILAVPLILLTVMNTVSNTGRLFFTISYVLMSGLVMVLLLLHIDISANLALRSTAGVDLAHAFLLGWVLVIYLIPVFMLGLIVSVIPNPHAWPMVGGNIYHYFVFSGRHHSAVIILLCVGIFAFLQLATLFIDVLTAITYVLVVAYAVSYHLHKRDHENGRSMYDEPRVS